MSAPIVFATDLSAAATVAGDVAARLAKTTGARLQVLHVAEPGHDDIELDAEAARLAAVGVDARAALRVGPVVDTVAAFAEEMKAGYVVVGAQGRGARAALGTVATALSARLPMAVFVVRAPGAAGTPGGLIGFLDRRGPMSVVITHALDDTFSGARDLLVELSRLGPLDVTVVHAPEVDSPLTAERKAEVERELGASVAKLPGVNARVVVHDGLGDARQRLLETVVEANPDLVICGTHQRLGVARLVGGSVAALLVRQAPCTVAVAPRP